MKSIQAYIQAQTQTTFERRFPDNQSCLEFLVKSRWPGGFICPHCYSKRSSRVGGRPSIRCLDCHRQISISAGTIFQAHKKSLKVWFTLIFQVATVKRSMSSLELSRKIGVTQTTAWYMMHKVKEAFTTVEENTKLEGGIEADEAIAGGSNTNKLKGRSSQKGLVGVAVEVRPSNAPQRRAMGRLGFEVLRSASAIEIEKWLKKRVKRKSVLITDGWKSYIRAAKSAGLRHKSAPQKGPKGVVNVVPRANAIIANLKCVIQGTHSGVSKEHLHRYLGAFAFRFNRRNELDTIYNQAIDAMILTKPITWREVVCAVSI